MSISGPHQVKHLRRSVALDIDCDMEGCEKSLTLPVPASDGPQGYATLPVIGLLQQRNWRWLTRASGRDVTVCPNHHEHLYQL